VGRPFQKRRTQKRALLLTNVDITRNYAGNLVMARALANAGWFVRVVGPFHEHVPNSPVFSGLAIVDTAIHRPTRSRRAPNKFVKVWRQAQIVFQVFRSLGSYDLVLCSEIKFSGLIALAKKMGLFDFKMVQSCGEFYGRSDGVSASAGATYRWSSNEWDGLVDVEANRLRLRLEELKLQCPAIVVPNTTYQEVGYAPPSREGSIPTLAYVGSVNPNADLPELIKSLRLVKGQARFIFALFGDHGAITKVASLARNELGERAIIAEPMTKTELSTFLMENCDGGIVHYPMRSIASRSQLYCAPGKLFDFLSLGLPVVTTSNPALRTLIETGSLGVAATEDSVLGFAQAVELLLERISAHQIDRLNIRAEFSARYSAESVGAEFLNWVERLK
jgi:glycosyltransferase involved in cell wall biosynthesis